MAAFPSDRTAPPVGRRRSSVRSLHPPVVGAIAPRRVRLAFCSGSSSAHPQFPFSPVRLTHLPCASSQTTTAPTPPPSRHRLRRQPPLEAPRCSLLPLAIPLPSYFPHEPTS
ncbi:hypothetical protein PVAP13_9KG478833 [Panicum virgatum]|uniref:Uncharacterized protein n=1 Tax=Panicum virgatum TaxID=38727 RepID=A0A8T0NVI0_PANVG|nr:hypothetical protein PVAP13_9KG478833 [Panicum virgatum]